MPEMVEANNSMLYYVFNRDEAEPAILSSNEEVAEYIEEFIETQGYCSDDFVVIKGDRLNIDVTRKVVVSIGGM